MSNGCDDYIRTFGQVAVANTFLKYATFILGVVSMVLSLLVVVLLGKARQVMPLPIYIDKVTGAARPVDYQSLDASGPGRIEVEIIDFCSTYITNLYTFNRYTIKSNLDQVFALSVLEVTEKVKYYLNESERARYLHSNIQGMCQVVYTDIVSTRPDIKVQVAFRKQILDEGGKEASGTSAVAIMRLKPVTRSVRNSHGLLVIEYRESPMREMFDETNR